jgi:hypothetical protein
VWCSAWACLCGARSGHRRAASSCGARPGHRTVSSAHRTLSGAPLAALMLVFDPNFVEFPNLFSLLVYVELYVPDINDN